MQRKVAAMIAVRAKSDWPSPLGECCCVCVCVRTTFQREKTSIVSVSYKPNLYCAKTSFADKTLHNVLVVIIILPVV